MSDDILYERLLPHGPAVRVRRVSAPGEQPVRAVLEVDRRAGTPREGIGTPPPLVTAEKDSDEAVLALLEPLAKDDSQVARLLRERGLR